MKTMAGCLKRDNGSSVEGRLDTPQTKVHFDLEGDSKSDKKVKSLFNQFVEAFLKEVFGVSCYRPLPPVIGEGQEVDLFELHTVVRKRGGYSSVSENGLWSSVATDCGFDLRTGAALKLVYVKYLHTLDRWLSKITDNKGQNTGLRETPIYFSGLLMELGSELKVFLSGTKDVVMKEEKFVDFKKSSPECGNDDNGFVKLNVDVKNVYEEQSVDKGSDGEEDSVARKRKRECSAGMLNWLIKVAKDPCNPAIDPLPENHKWKCYANDLEWKQILLVREAMLLKKNVDESSQQSVLQKKQRMHPSMYEDDQCGSERLRYSQRLLSAKDSSRKTQIHFGRDYSSGCQSDDEFSEKRPDSMADRGNFWFNHHCEKRVPIGPSFQADLPEFCGDVYGCDPKWLGTKIWPLDKSEQNKSCLIERDAIGKGRQESCGCEVSGSPKCVRFHIREKRVKVRLELSSAFYKWKFDDMGEIVALSWTNNDENKFRDIVASNRLSSEKYFWDELFKAFPEKGREALVSYYFNVFLLQRRVHQNRSSPSNIDSDDEESEFGPIANRFGQMAANTPSSIFRSPKKTHLNSK